MRQFFYFAAVCMLALTACKGSFKKADKGVEYKIISRGSGKPVGYGQFMQIHVKQVYSGSKDTILMNTWDYMSRMQTLDSVSTPLTYYKILSQLKKGDSLVLRMLTDSAFKDNPQQMPAFMKKGKYLYTHLSVINIFENREQADSAAQAEFLQAKPRIYAKQMEQIEKDIAAKKSQIEADGKEIEAYLAKNNIKATKTKWGVYVSIVNEGTGPLINSNSVASVNYTGRTLDSGKVFDSNVDPKFNHVRPYDVNISAFDVVLGWTDALMTMKKGTKAIIFVPSALGYGENGNGSEIKPGDNLVFDMEIVDVMDESQFMAKQKAQQEEIMRKMQEQQNQPADTLKKAGK
jgi:FKBP-type peptidyl-prolyl cis-trans isomerase FkpA